MLTSTQLQLIKATVPTLQVHGTEITRVFYASLFRAHPELLNIFNPVNQKNGRQANTLAASILSYAAHIDHLDRLGSMVNQIAHKHVSLDVLPEHYPIVGEHLLGAIQTVLGDAATLEILDAWAAAYRQLASIMMGVEGRMKAAGAEQEGGWHGFKPFTLTRRVQESAVITSFELTPQDGQPLPLFHPGQYISVQLQVPGQATRQIRQYSLSDAPNGRTYRISVKRESAPFPDADLPHGLISSHLHDGLHLGDTVLVHMPAGDFVLRDNARPVVLLSGGVGVTPMISMVNTLVANKSTRPVLFVHAALNRDVHAFREHVNSLTQTYPNLRKQVYYAQVMAEDQPGMHHDVEGLLSMDMLRPLLPLGDAEYYYCGPAGFAGAVEGLLDALGVPAEQRFTETFGPSRNFEVPSGTD
ncbi:NO-inducible flavohemoprotein [Deinococcus humi]|uniref:Flavohemoprotein n=1 Tax=Deinococcus humi TaxID=662880 RepID=A0A7W8NDV7_9DEIO|nr:NO-inducible flavohemoprotein [Deinococcus humi]MBB5363629.1 nitric oxide dioxygenase [Deinococcus humi]GGO29984.1 flavohemoprotein [Deinococcus humi]